MSLPVGLLTFNGTVVSFTTSSARKHLASIYFPPRMTAVWVAAMSHLPHGFDFFVFLVQAGTRDAFPVK